MTHRTWYQALVTTLLFTLVFTACIGKPAAPTTPSASETPTVTVQPTETTKLKAEYEITATIDGQTALALLQSQAEVETKDYGTAGQFVTKINGLEGNNEYYWAFYVNGEYAEKGASQTTLKKGDTIKFVYEAVAISN